MFKFNTRRICWIAMLSALCFLLNMVQIRLPANLRITFDSLPVVVAALLFGPMEATLAAVFGSTATIPSPLSSAPPSFASPAGW